MGLKCARAAAQRAGDASFALEHVDDDDLLFRIITKFPGKKDELTQEQIENIENMRDRFGEVSVPVQAGSS